MQFLLRTTSSSTVERQAPAASQQWTLLLRRFVEYLVSECGLAANTIEAYSRDLREFLVELLDQKIIQPQDVTPVVVRGFLVRLSERKLALSTIARNLVSVKMFMRYLFT